jgi:hypothetical protein
MVGRFACLSCGYDRVKTGLDLIADFAATGRHWIGKKGG